MKYLMLLLTIFILTSCRFEKEYLYVNTIAITYDNEYEVSILKYQDDESIKGTERGKTIEEAINELDKKAEFEIGLNYVSNIIIDVNSINDKVINDILDFVANSENISLNFCVSASNNINELLDIRVISKSTNTIFFISPKKLDNIYQLPFLEFSKRYRFDKSYEIPLLEISNVYEKKTIYTNTYVKSMI